MTSSAKSLQGLTIMVTRPKHLANNLARLIEEKGGIAVLYPVISIEEPDDKKCRDQLLNKLSAFDIAIFISPTAVIKTFEQIDTLPSKIQVAAIGSSTEDALTQRGIEVSIKPAGHDSETLLMDGQLQPAQLTGKSVIIFRGQGGRELLGNTLVSRGAAVSYVEIYKRARNDNLPLLSKNSLNVIDIITVTSNETLQHVFDLTEEKTMLLNIPLLVPGIRSQHLAEKLGFKNILRSDNATDAACIEALHAWATSQ